MKKAVFTTLLTLFAWQLNAQTAIGEWRDHFPYNSTISVVEGGGRAYAATEFGIFSYNLNDNSIERLTKVNGLSDFGISAMEWSEALNALVVGYNNGNLDVIKPSRNVNISDIKRSGILGDKAIYDIFMDEEFAYLSCGFGIVIMDLDREEVRETLLIGPGGSQVKVNNIAFFNDTIFAATDDGLYKAWKFEINLGNFNNWSRRMDIPHADGPFNEVEEFAGKLFVNFRVASQNNMDTLYYWDAGWQVFTSVLDRSNIDIDSRTGDDIIITHNSDIQVYDTDFVDRFYMTDYLGHDARPRACIKSQTGGYWVADAEIGLVYKSFNNELSVIPNGPEGSEAHRLDIAEGNLWVTTGALAGNWGNEFEKNGVHKFIGNSWGSINRDNEPELQTGWNTYGGGVNDFIAVAVDPNNPSRVFIGTWDEGLIEMRNGAFFQYHTPATSTLQANADNVADGKVDIAGLTFDVHGNLWITNSNVEKPISVYTGSGIWRSFDPGSVLGGNTLLADIVATETGLKWVVRPRGNGILVYKDNNTITNPADDDFKVLNAFEGSGGLPTMDVYALAVDLDGEVWVGTAEGVVVYYNPDAVFSGGNYDAQQILIEQDGNIQILLETEVVTSIAVDGANRKWFGTQGAGVFLMSEDGTEQIHHFTKDNSPLLSNAINDIAIDELTGEVFFATEKGIISYKSDATGGGESASCAKVYPNPVRETYSGPIAITGLVRDSDVKITDVSGNLVYRTTSEGGQALWYGNNMDGQRVNTGVYLAFSTDREGEKSCVTKILFIK